MSNKISWTDATWSPVTGCAPISPGCANCWAKRMSHRLAGRYGYPAAPDQFNVTLHPDRLEQPLRWRKPRRVFVCSMGDLFHEDVPFEFVIKVWQTMFKAKAHTFQILTKRPERMRDFVLQLTNHLEDSPPVLPNVHLGVTAEDQQRADERIPVLLEIPAAFHYVSLEPLLSDIRFHSRWLSGYHYESGPLAEDVRRVENNSLSLVIVGGETGPGARPMDVKWARDIRDQCRSAGVAFHFKQMSKRAPIPEDLMIREFPGQGAK